MVSLAGRSRISSGLVAFAARLEERDRLLAVPFLALERIVACDDLAHLCLDRGKILGAEGFVAREVVVEAVLDRRPDRHLRAGVEGLHRLGQHMRRIVADHLQRIRIAPCDEHHRCVVIDRPRQVGRLAVQLHRQRRARQARADGGSDVGARDCPIKAANGAVGQGYGGHREGSLDEAASMALRGG